ncbi:MAG: hypothetical protein H3C34_01090 [Caldilineaceae bacterium]|nr:hypothetical protein [Caldilineaceae bacterium]
MVKRRETFILRVWTDSAGQPGVRPRVRVAVQPAGSESIQYFASLEQLVRFIEERLSQPGQDPVS